MTKRYNAAYFVAMVTVLRREQAWRALKEIVKQVSK